MNKVKIQELNERAKQNSDYTLDLDIGETAYLEALTLYVREFREKRLTAEQLAAKQKELESKLERYYQHCAMFDRHIRIYNKYSHVLTEAEKGGCDICKKIVIILDGRE